MVNSNTVDMDKRQEVTMISYYYLMTNRYQISLICFKDNQGILITKVNCYWFSVAL